MTLASSLLLVFFVFCLLMGGVLAFCLRERKQNAALSTAEKDTASDNRVAVILFGAIVLGALLAITTAWLIFFRDWT